METKVVKNGIVVTVDKDRTIIRDGAVVFQGNKIVDVGKTNELEKKYRADEVIDAHEKLVIPGFINTHMHTNIVRGEAETFAELARPWHDVFNEVRAQTTFEDCRKAALLAYAEGIRSGITTYVDFTRQGAGSGKAAEEAGVRAAVVPMIYDLYDRQPWSESLDESLRLARQTCGNPDARVRYWLGFDDYTSSSPQSIDKIVEEARRLPVDIHTHSNEICYEEPSWCKKNLGMYGLEYLKKHGCVGPDVLIAHCVTVHWKEIRILKETGTRIAHCSSTNIKTGVGAAPIPEYLASGLPVGLATDNTMGTPVNMFMAMRCAMFIQRLTSRHPWALDPDDVFGLATIGGARAMGMQDKIGSIEKGKRADLVLIDLRTTHFTPAILGEKTNLIHQLVNMGESSDVNTVIIDGKTVMQNRVLRTVDERKVIQDLSDTAFALLKRSSLRKYDPIF
jgi:5-methylthioadenosine/S-adenosylhomocysteine deaminase